MFEYTERQPACKPNPKPIDDDADHCWVITLVAAKFHLPLSVARLIVQHAGLGGSEAEIT
jgi:hypothetical protein